MLTTHIDTLREWFDNAEDGDIYEGDTFIRHLPEVGRFVVGVAEEVLGAHPDYRILARAPKPKPAWHDAVAVTATATDDLGDEITAVWVREGDELWRSDEGGMVLRDDLRDVTPLIEAKVTGAMTVAAISAYRGIDRSALSEFTRDEVEDMRRALAAALGLETE